MADSIKLKVEVDGSESVKTLGTLEQQLVDLKNEIKDVDVGSKQFKALSDEIRKTESEVKNLNKSYEGLDNEALTGEFGKLAGGITAAATGIASLGGEANKSMEALIQTVAQGMAVAEGFRGATEALSAAQKVYNAVLKANPIGLIITAFTVFIGIIVALITKGEKIKEMLTGWAERFTFLKKPVEIIKSMIDGLTSAWEWLQKTVMGEDAFEEKVAKQKEKREAEAEVKRLERLLKRKQAEGATAAEIIAIETQLIEEKKKLQEQGSEEWETLEDERIQKQREYNEKALEEQKVANEKAKELRKINDDRIKAERIIALEGLMQMKELELKTLSDLEDKNTQEQLAKFQEGLTLRTEYTNTFLEDQAALDELWNQTRLDNLGELNAQEQEEYDTQLAALQSLYDEKLLTEEQFLARSLELQGQYYNNLTQKQKNFVEWANMTDAARATFVLDSLSQIFAGAAALFEEQTAAYKIFASAQIVMDSASAIIKTWNAYAGIPIAGPILAGLQTAVIAATAVAQLAKINGVKFAEGGVVVGPKHEQGGVMTQFGELEGGEGVINAASMTNASLRNLASIANTAGGGKDFSVGDGSVKLSTDSISMIVGGINDKKVFVSETDITETQKRVAVIEQNSVL